MQNDIVKQQPEASEVEQPVTSQQVPLAVQQSPDAPEGGPTNVEEAVPSVERAGTPEAAALPIDSHPKHVSTRPTGIILAAVFVCLCLVGAAFYGGVSQTKVGDSSKRATAVLGESTTAVQAIDIMPAISSAQALKDVPQTSVDELSDQALGL